MGRVLIKMYDKNNNVICFGRDLTTTRFVDIIFQGCSYIVTSNFLNIIKNEYMCKKYQWLTYPKFLSRLDINVLN